MTSCYVCIFNWTLLLLSFWFVPFVLLKWLGRSLGIDHSCQGGHILCDCPIRYYSLIKAPKYSI